MAVETFSTPVAEKPPQPPPDDAARVASGTLACRVVIAAQLSAVNSRAPSGAAPPPRCARANVTRSVAVIVAVEPAGAKEMGRA